MAALDLPDIPGVPMDVIPPFVHAIRVATKFFAKYHDRAYVEEEPKNTFSSLSLMPPVVLDSLMDRMEAATEATTNSASQDVQERKQQMHNATQRWLESVKRFAKVSQKTNDTKTTRNDEETNKPRISVPYACFLYIWDLQQTHERVAVRRAGLYLSGLLLQRSKDCRFHLEQDDHLTRWMKHTLLEYTPTKFIDDLPLLQLEADYWLNHLVEKGYARLYPKIRVASQRLRQQCPHIRASDHMSPSTAALTTFSSMVDWRRIRDIALAHGDKEIAHVERLINQAHQCLEIVVPRLGVEPSTETNNNIDANFQNKRTNNGNHEEDDDEDIDIDIEWEDGGDDFDDGTTNIPLPNFEHISAVERTLAAMESAGGIQGGEIEIDLRDDSKKKMEEEFDQPRDAEAEEKRAAALGKFQKCVSLLARRHMPRLSVWLEGLRNADNLVLVKASLVSLPSETASRRRKLIDMLTEMKQSVSSVLTSASRLDVNKCNGEDVDGAPESAIPSSESTALLSLRLSFNTSQCKGREQLLSAMHRKRVQSRNARSNRVQIKFRSNCK